MRALLLLGCAVVARVTWATTSAPPRCKDLEIGALKAEAQRTLASQAEVDIEVACLTEGGQSALTVFHFFSGVHQPRVASTTIGEKADAQTPRAFWETPIGKLSMPLALLVLFKVVRWKRARPPSMWKRLLWGHHSGDTFRWAGWDYQILAQARPRSSDH